MTTVVDAVMGVAMKKIKKQKMLLELTEIVAICSHILPESVESHVVSLSCFLTPDVNIDTQNIGSKRTRVRNHKERLHDNQQRGTLCE